MPLIETAPEVQLAVERLLDKLERWLILQPEWLLLMGLPERQVRKRVADLVAKELLLMPKRAPSEVPGREMRRAIQRELEKSLREWWKGLP